MESNNEPEERPNELSKERITALLAEIAPGSLLVAIRSFPGSYANMTHLVEAKATDGRLFRVVVRCYARFGDSSRSEKARREFRIFQLLAQFGVPASRPLFLDDLGKILGSPGIVTGYVTGNQVAQPRDAAAWAHALAAMLAKIHAIPGRGVKKRPSECQ